MKKEAVGVDGRNSAPATEPLGLKALFAVVLIDWLCVKPTDGCGVIEGGVSAPLATMPPPTPSRLSTPAMIGCRPPNSQSESAPAILKNRFIPDNSELRIGDAAAHLDGGGC